MKLRDILIVSLIVANVVLGAIAVGIWLGRVESTAYAESQMRAGDYVMVTGPISSSRDALLVIDTVARRANLYVPRAGAGTGGQQWEMVATRNLQTDFRGP